MPINTNGPNYDADKLTIAFNPENSTPTLEAHTTATNQLSAILNGVDDKIYCAEPYDVVGGRLDTSTSDGSATNTLKWNWANSNQIRLYNNTLSRWELVKVTTNPTAIVGTNLDMCGNALTYNVNYDVYAKYSSATAFTLEFAPWSSATHGDYNTGVTTCTTTMTSDVLPAPCAATADSELDAQRKPAMDALDGGDPQAAYTAFIEIVKWRKTLFSATEFNVSDFLS